LCSPAISIMGLIGYPLLHRLSICTSEVFDKDKVSA
jgi:hypothetical protein